MSDPGPVRAEGSVDAVSTWQKPWHSVYYVVLAASLVLACVDEGFPSPVCLALTAALAGWHYAWRPRPAWSKKVAPHLVYALGGVALSCALFAVAPAFLIAASMFYSQVAKRTRTAVSIPIAVVNGAALVCLVGWRLGGAWAVTVAALFVVAIVFTAFIGALVAQNRARQELVETLQAERANRAEAERVAGVLEERQRMARELHDTVTQDLIGITMHLETARSSLHDPHHGAAGAHLARALASARDALTQARSLVWSSSPAPSKACSEALRELGNRFREQTGVVVEVVVDGVDEGAEDRVVEALVATARESLNNVRKHARAKRVVVTAVRAGEEVLLDIHDDGVGLSGGPHPVSDRGGGFGLRALRERAAELGGELGIESRRGEGTTVHLRVPARAAVRPVADREVA